MPRPKSTNSLKLVDTIAELYFLLRPDYSEDLTHQSIRVLQYIGMCPTPPRIDDVRQFVGGAATSASELVKRLSARGLVVRSRSETDERVVRLSLSERGQEVLRQHTHMDPAKVAIALSGISATDADQVVALLSTILEKGRSKFG